MVTLTDEERAYLAPTAAERALHLTAYDGPARRPVPLVKVRNRKGGTGRVIPRPTPKQTVRICHGSSGLGCCPSHASAVRLDRDPDLIKSNTKAHRTFETTNGSPVCALHGYDDCGKC